MATTQVSSSKEETQLEIDYEGQPLEHSNGPLHLTCDNCGQTELTAGDTVYVAIDDRGRILSVAHTPCVDNGGPRLPEIADSDHAVLRTTLKLGVGGLHFTNVEVDHVGPHFEF